MKNLTNIHNGKYDLHGNLFFDTDQGTFKISQKDALEIVYTLFDSAGHSYNELHKLEDELFYEE